MSKQKIAHHEPFIRMSKRDGLPLWKSLGVRLIGLESGNVILDVGSGSYKFRAPVR